MLKIKKIFWVQISTLVTVGRESLRSTIRSVVKGRAFAWDGVKSNVFKVLLDLNGLVFATLKGK